MCWLPHIRECQRSFSNPCQQDTSRLMRPSSRQKVVENKKKSVLGTCMFVFHYIAPALLNSWEDLALEPSVYLEMFAHMTSPKNLFLGVPMIAYLHQKPRKGKIELESK